MNYKGYTARIEFDAEDGIFVGRLIGIQDLVSFHAEMKEDLLNAFHESVDDYLSACEKFRKPPSKAIKACYPAGRAAAAAQAEVVSA